MSVRNASSSIYYGNVDAQKWSLVSVINLLVKKDELVTDLTNIMYRHTDAVEKMSKVQAALDKQLVDSMQQIKNLAANWDLKAKQLANVEAAAQVVADMVDYTEASDRTLVERLRVFLQRITSFISDTSKQYLAYALGLVKSFWPSANLALIGDGLAEGCSEEKFSGYVEEVKPAAEKVIDDLEWPSDGEA
jgi:hypothetical protein